MHWHPSTALPYQKETSEVSVELSQPVVFFFLNLYNCCPLATPQDILYKVTFTENKIPVSDSESTELKVNLYLGRLTERHTKAQDVEGRTC